MRDAWMCIKVSKDKSANFGAATEHFLGEEGQFDVPVIRRRMGNARQMSLRVSWTSPVRVDVLAMAMQASRER